MIIAYFILQVETPDLLILDEPLAGLGMEMHLLLYISEYWLFFNLHAHGIQVGP